MKREKIEWRRLFLLSWIRHSNGLGWNAFIFLLDLIIHQFIIGIIFLLHLTNDKETILKSYGWIGSVLFAICGYPQAIKSIKEGHSDGCSFSFLLMWLLGEIFTITYVLPKGDIPLLLNYTLNMVFVLTIFYYKIFPKYEVGNS